MTSNFPQYRGALAGIGTFGLEKYTVDQFVGADADGEGKNAAAVSTMGIDEDTDDVEQLMQKIPHYGVLARRKALDGKTDHSARQFHREQTSSPTSKSLVWIAGEHISVPFLNSPDDSFLRKVLLRLHKLNNARKIMAKNNWTREWLQNRKRQEDAELKSAQFDHEHLFEKLTNSGSRRTSHQGTINHEATTTSPADHGGKMKLTPTVKLVLQDELSTVEKSHVNEDDGGYHAEDRKDSDEEDNSSDDQDDDSDEEAVASKKRGRRKRNRSKRSRRKNRNKKKKGRNSSASTSSMATSTGRSSVTNTAHMVFDPFDKNQLKTILEFLAFRGTFYLFSVNRNVQSILEILHAEPAVVVPETSEIKNSTSSPSASAAAPRGAGVAMKNKGLAEESTTSEEAIATLPPALKGYRSNFSATKRSVFLRVFLTDLMNSRELWTELAKMEKEVDELQPRLRIGDSVLEKSILQKNQLKEIKLLLSIFTKGNLFRQLKYAGKGMLGLVEKKLMETIASAEASAASGSRASTGVDVEHGGGSKDHDNAINPGLPSSRKILFDAGFIHSGFDFYQSSIKTAGGGAAVEMLSKNKNSIKKDSTSSTKEQFSKLKEKLLPQLLPAFSQSSLPLIFAHGLIYEGFYTKNTNVEAKMESRQLQDSDRKKSKQHTLSAKTVLQSVPTRALSTYSLVARQAEKTHFYHPLVYSNLDGLSFTKIEPKLHLSGGIVPLIQEEKKHGITSFVEIFNATEYSADLWNENWEVQLLDWEDEGRQEVDHSESSSSWWTTLTSSTKNTSPSTASSKVETMRQNTTKNQDLVFVVGKNTENWARFLRKLESNNRAAAAEGHDEQAEMLTSGASSTPTRGAVSVIHFPNVTEFFAKHIDTRPQGEGAGEDSLKSDAQHDEAEERVSTKTILEETGRFVVCNGVVTSLGNHDIVIASSSDSNYDTTSATATSGSRSSASSNENTKNYGKKPHENIGTVFPFPCTPQIMEVLGKRPDWEEAIARDTKRTLKIFSSKDENAAGKNDVQPGVLAILEPLAPSTPIVARTLQFLHEDKNIGNFDLMIHLATPIVESTAELLEAPKHNAIGRDLRHWTKLSIYGNEVAPGETTFENIKTSGRLYLEIVPPSSSWQLLLTENSTGDLDNLRANEVNSLDQSFKAEYEVTGIQYTVNADVSTFDAERISSGEIFLPKRKVTMKNFQLVEEKQKRGSIFGMEEELMCLPIAGANDSSSTSAGLRNKKSAAVVDGTSTSQISTTPSSSTTRRMVLPQLRSETHVKNQRVHMRTTSVNANKDNRYVFTVGVQEFLAAARATPMEHQAATSSATDSVDVLPLQVHFGGFDGRQSARKLSLFPKPINLLTSPANVAGSTEAVLSLADEIRMEKDLALLEPCPMTREEFMSSASAGATSAATSSAPGTSTTAVATGESSTTAAGSKAAQEEVAPAAAKTTTSTAASSTTVRASKSRINQGEKTIHIFSVASGWQYERLLRIMMTSARHSTPLDWRLQFYVLKDFLSSNFDENEIEQVLPNTGVELLPVPAWPDYLKKTGSGAASFDETWISTGDEKIGIRKDKQRLIWAYKILFLDQLFYQRTDRIIFIDADQIVKSSLVPLWKTSQINTIDEEEAGLAKNPLLAEELNVPHILRGELAKQEMERERKLKEYSPAWAFVPFCHGKFKNNSTLGHRFWDSGYWKNLLETKISDMFVGKRTKKDGGTDGDKKDEDDVDADDPDEDEIDQDQDDDTTTGQGAVAIEKRHQGKKTAKARRGSATTGTSDNYSHADSVLPKPPKQKHYHISALFVVNIPKFIQIGAPDLLRHTFKELGQDSNSLSNLDQDLPNYLYGTDQLQIHSLHRSWLFCETWCDTELNFEAAKTVDLCQNPLTKEHKLDQAKRIGGVQWMRYDRLWGKNDLRVEGGNANEKPNKNKITRRTFMDYIVSGRGDEAELEMEMNGAGREEL
ncbi:unnamed protein product [Amoebophrya sp. A120]|nr:unnamed protein product [Amoebophrya sp. A120]|eukprot:GSA120T00004479001.1